FIAIFSTLSRMHRDSEMVIWFSSGKGLAAWLGPLLRFAWPILAAIATLALLVLPWTNQRIDELKQQYERRGDLERVEAGRFQESADGQRVFFVEKDGFGPLAGNNVFVASNQPEGQTVTSARSGRVEVRDGGRFLILGNGQRLDTQAGTGGLRIGEFAQYGVRIGTDPLGGSVGVAVNTLPTLELMRQPTPAHRAELSWRFGLVLAAFNFVVLGLTVSRVNPRVGRSTNLLYSLFAFIVYLNLLNLGQSWIASERVGFASYLLGLHGGALALGLLGVARQHHGWHWRRLLRRRRPEASGARA
ncbi:MAG: LPS export ABC transporter permease LptF, partial [Rhodoferax sp.]|nr:LPS export ABC transporter permease LptF [Rhodoferax sp.]